MHPRQRKHRLRIQRMFDPERAVLIESGDAIRGLDVLAAGLVRHFLDEGDYRLFRRSIVPGRELRRLGIRANRLWHCAKRRSGEDTGSFGNLVRRFI